MPRRDLGEYVERLIFSLRHTRCCWNEDQWPGTCDGMPYAYTDRVQRSEITEGGFEDFVLARTELRDRLAVLTERERMLVGVYAWMGRPGGPYQDQAMRLYAWLQGMEHDRLKAAVKEALRKMALGVSLERKAS